jgi:predicted thioesterase
MVLFIEEVCRKMVEPFLADGESTVGVSLKVRHLAPTPMGQTVRCRAEVVAVEGGLITFRAEVWDMAEKIGEVEHKRVVIDVDRFLRRVEAKAGPGSSRRQDADALILPDLRATTRFAHYPHAIVPCRRPDPPVTAALEPGDVGGLARTPTIDPTAAGASSRPLCQAEEPGLAAW